MLLSQQRKWLLFLALATWAVYLQTVGFGYVQLDDPHHIFENPSFYPPSLSHTFRYWLEPFFGMYIPFTYTVWQMTGLFSLSPFLFHLLNVTLHLLSTCVVYSLLVFLLNRKQKSPHHFFIAFLGAFVFCVHPAQAESVAWISGTKDVLFSFLLLLALQLNLVSQDRRLSHLFFFLALASKPTAVVGPFLLIGLNRFFCSRSWEESIREALPWLLMIFPFAAITKFLQADFRVQDLAPAWSRPLVALDTFGFYLAKTLWPFRLSLDYGRTPHVVIEEGARNLFLYLAPTVGGVAFLLRKKIPGIAWGLGVFVLGFLPVCGLVAFQYQLFSTVADRYLYLSLFGVSIAVAFSLRECLGTRWEKPVLGFWALALVGLTVLGFRQVTFWRSNEAMFERAIAVNPHSFLAHNNYAFWLYTQKKPREAAEHFAKVIELRPKDPLLRMNYAVALIGSGEKEKGVRVLEEAQKMAPENIQIQNALEQARRP